MPNIHSSISFALVNIPVILNPVIKDNDTSFNQLHKDCLNRIKYIKYCPHCDKQINESHIIKGYEYEKNAYLTFKKEELESLKPINEKEIEIISFVNESEIDPCYFEKSYMLNTENKSKAYHLFCEALRKTKKVALAKTVIGSKFYYAILRFIDQGIIMTTLYFDEEINLPENNSKPKIDAKELELAIALVKKLEGKFEPEKYKDEYQDKIKEAIDLKLSGKTIKKTKKKNNEQVNNLLEALEKEFKEKMNLFINRDWTPMLLSEEKEPFDNKDYLFELKFDGTRALIFVNKNTFQIKNRHNQDITYLYPELACIKNIIKKDTILDGEIVTFVDGVPSYAKLQERAHLKNLQKIKYQAANNPVIFIAFDIIYENKSLENIPLLTRKKILDKIPQNEFLIVNKYILEEGINFYQEVKKLNLEGIVAKQVDSLYHINKRTNDWIKIKNLIIEKFFITGYKNTRNGLSLLLGEKRKKDFHYVGKVTISKKRQLYNEIVRMTPQTNSSLINYQDDEYTYIEPKLTCFVSYMERTRNNHLRQPTFREYD